MPWYDNAVFYHIYPLGATGAPKQNDYSRPVVRLKELTDYLPHLQAMGFTALYIGPLFQSVGHGYETTDYKILDSRLGTNADLKNFVKECHQHDLRVIFDGVFNHTGRDFFAFEDIKTNREGSPYRDWYQNVNFWGNNEYNDGFSYDNWGGYNLLVKLNHHNPAVRDYICDVVKFWIEEFDVDGLRLDAADVLHFDFMKQLRAATNHMKPDFWLMGEVIHGEYSRWANEDTLHSVTNYHLHKALYSGHNEHNYFEIAHTVKRLQDQSGGKLKLYNFVDNHDVERIFTKLQNKAHFVPVHILLYTLPGVPSVYYGSEWGIEGKKEQGSDDSLRPAVTAKEMEENTKASPLAKLIAALGKARKSLPVLGSGSYKELVLTNRQYAFARENVMVAVNNDDAPATVTLPATEPYQGLLFGKQYTVEDEKITVEIPANSGEILVPATMDLTPAGVEKALEAIEAKSKQEQQKKVAEKATLPKVAVDLSKPYEQMEIAELQQAILQKMANNGPVTPQMEQDVRNNTHHGSLLNWVKSFR